MPLPAGQVPGIRYCAGDAVIVGGQQSGHGGNEKRMQGNPFQPVFNQLPGSASVGILNGGDCQKKEKFLGLVQAFRIFLQLGKGQNRTVCLYSVHKVQAITIMKFHPKAPVSWHGTDQAHRLPCLLLLRVKACKTPLPFPGRGINIIDVGGQIALAVHHINKVFFPVSPDVSMAETKAPHEKILPEIRIAPDVPKVPGA